MSEMDIQFEQPSLNLQFGEQIIHESGGTSNYNELSNQPAINGHTLIGDQSAEDLGLGTYSKPSGGIPASDIANGVVPTTAADIGAVGSPVLLASITKTDAIVSTISQVNETNDTFVIDNPDWVSNNSFYGDTSYLTVDLASLQSANAFYGPSSIQGFGGKVWPVSNGDGTYSFKNASSTVLSLAMDATYKNPGALRLHHAGSDPVIENAINPALESGHTVRIVSKGWSGALELFDNDNVSIGRNGSTEIARPVVQNGGANTAFVETSVYEFISGRFAATNVCNGLPVEVSLDLKLVDGWCEVSGSYTGWWYKSASDGTLQRRRYLFSGAFKWNGISKVKLLAANYTTQPNGSWIKVYDMGGGI